VARSALVPARRPIDRRLLVVSALIAAGLALVIIGFASGRTGERATTLPAAFLVLYPKPGELVLRQSEVGAKLQPGYFDPGQGTILFTPKEGATISKFAAGEHTLTVFYWRVTETRDDAQAFSWTFKVS
jgi:hypothetical protein